MDHDHDHDHGTGNPAQKSCPMIMVFHGGHCERILWKGWVASTMTEFVFSCLAFFLLSIIYEGLKFVREYLYRTTIKKEKEKLGIDCQSRNNGQIAGDGVSSSLALADIPEKSLKEKIFNYSHAIQTTLNLIQVTISYLLMLVFMNFNYWLCLAVILGLTLGYFLFGWIKQQAYENECCH